MHIFASFGGQGTQQLKCLYNLKMTSPLKTKKIDFLARKVEWYADETLIRGWQAVASSLCI